MSSFVWPASIPSGQRTFTTPSCIIRKTIKSIEIKTPSGEIIDLFDENNGMEETDRLAIISGAIGTYCGIKNSLYAGYVRAFAINPIVGDYSDCSLTVKWVSEGKKSLTCSVYKFMGAAINLYDILEEV
jgi:hypothetical protein